MNSWIRSYYKQFRQHGHNAKDSLDYARTVNEFRDLENDGVVRITAEAEEESYFDVYGEPAKERERKAIEHYLDLWGCWCVRSEYFDGEEWQHADSIGMCVYDDPTSPFENCYVPDLMREAIEQWNKIEEERQEAIVYNLS